MIAIVDYGVGNLASVKNMIKKAGGKAVITSDHELITSAEKIILPGVGAFGVGMSNLKEQGLETIIKNRALSGVKILGICLGAQLLTKYSEENECEGLGLIPAKTVRFNISNKELKVPHMGWNQIQISQKEHPLLQNLHVNPRFYFVHSYYLTCDDPSYELCNCTYGHTFSAGIAKGYIAGFQFHPEKSHVFGLKVMENFLLW
jgi:glutamine amidotransferase